MKVKNRSAKKIKTDLQTQSPTPEHLMPKKSTHKKLKKSVDEAQSSLKGQKKLTSYFQTNSTLIFQQPASQSPQQTSSQQLRQEIKEQEHTKEKLKQQKQILESNYGKLYRQHKSYKSQAKKVIINVLRQKYYMLRKQNGKIINQLGYIGQDNKFVHGDIYNGIERELAQKKQQLQKIEEGLCRVKSQDTKHSLLFQKKMIKKTIKQLQAQISKRKHQIAQYKARMKLHSHQLRCHYALQKWPLIQGSNKTQRYLVLCLKAKLSHSQIYTCFDVQQSQYVIMSRNKLNKYKLKSEQLQNMKDLKHQNIGRVLDILHQKENIIQVIYEGCGQRSLQKYINEEISISEEQIKNIIIQILRGLAYLQQINLQFLCHQINLQSLSYQYGIVRISCFSIPQEYKCKSSHIRDVGILFYEIISGKKIEQEVDLEKQALQSRIMKSLGISLQVKQFLRKCIFESENAFISCKQALNHTYLQK